MPRIAHTRRVSSPGSEGRSEARGGLTRLVTPRRSKARRKDGPLASARLIRLAASALNRKAGAVLRRARRDDAHRRRPRVRRRRGARALRARARLRAVVAPLACDAARGDRLPADAVARDVAAPAARVWPTRIAVGDLVRVARVDRRACVPRVGVGGVLPLPGVEPQNLPRCLYRSRAARRRRPLRPRRQRSPRGEGWRSCSNPATTHPSSSRQGRQSARKLRRMRWQ